MTRVALETFRDFSGGHLGDLTAGTMRGPTRLTRRGSIPGRAARGSISPRKATCQVPTSGLSSFGPRSPARAKGATASSIFKINYKDKQGDDLEEMTK